MTDIDIKYFLEVVNQGNSWTRAAQTVYVSQPALTKHINKLGEELGAKLFDTSKKNAPHLTPAGKLYYDFFSRMAGQFKQTQTEVGALKNAVFGQLAIAIVANWNMEEFAAQAKNFRNKYPYVNFSLVAVYYPELKAGLLNGRFDLAFCFRDVLKEMDNLVLRPVRHVKGVLLYSKTHPLARKKGLTVRDFRDDTFYTGEDLDPTLRTKDIEYCRAKGFDPIVKIVPNLGSILFALQGGSGYTIVSNLTRETHGALFKYLSLQDMDFTITCAWNKDNRNPALTAFLATIVEMFS
jgi:DNA-binding transcriptional LysR family regulator